jgi:cation diffusion facilitator family transporter
MLTGPHRRSRAALRRMKGSENARTIAIALTANLIITCAKLAAGLVARSTGMLAEAAHSLVDSLNEVFLWISLRRAARPADTQHPYGHGRERFLWAFMAAVASFLIGGCLSIALAVRDLGAGHEAGSMTASWIVLVVAFVAEGTSWLQSAWRARREARERGLGVWSHLFRSTDPILRAVVFEDTAALLGLLIAAAGLLVSRLTGSHEPDAIAALLIGVLLSATAFVLARPLADLLIGSSLPPDQIEQLVAIVTASPAVEQLLSLRAVYTGPEEAVVAARIHPVATLDIEALTRAMDDLDHALRAGSPFVADVYIDVTSYRAEPPHSP